jgi:two-component system response regulator QseB
MRILLVEDDPMIGKTLQTALAQEGYTVDWVKDGAAGRLALDTSDGAYGLVLLDLGLPRKSGLDLLKEIRRGGNKVRVLVVTARDAVADRVAGLDAGADDYLVKPFSLDELGARMRALLRRDIAREDNVLRHGDLALDSASRTVTRAGAPVELSAREFTLLEALLERPGAALSKAQLEERLYGWGEEVESNTVEVHVHNLR